MRKYLFILLIILCAIGIYIFLTSSKNNTSVVKSLPTPSLTPTATTSAQQHVLGARVKTTDCHAQNALPDADCTPGAVFADATTEQICTAGYAASVRDVPNAEKQQVFAEYGIATHAKGEYEVDHLISLELGGSNDIANLWPEAATPTPGFHQKDGVENYLHMQVCSGEISLQQAQNEISTNWLSVYNAMPH